MVVETVVETFGPFLIPAMIFTIGFVGYIVLVLLTRYGLLPGREND